MSKQSPRNKIADSVYSVLSRSSGTDPENRIPSQAMGQTNPHHVRQVIDGQMLRPPATVYGRVGLVILMWLATISAMAAERNASFMAAVASIQSDELRHHVVFLADDQREGREAGSRGNRQASDYLAEAFHEQGLSGGGVDGGYFQPFEPNYRNVIARIPGSDPELKNEYVLVGAHYDHIGYGTRRTSLGTVGLIHNGADDNASGTSAILELAEAFSILPQSPRRSILFVCWDAEEKGMLGSYHWVSHPTVPVEQVVMLLNLDMIGQLRDEKLTILGSRTGYRLRRLVSLQNEQNALNLDFSWLLKPNADHFPFLERGIPILMLHTGLHHHYHRSTDDSHRLNVQGMREVVRLLFRMTYEFADQDTSPKFRPSGRQETEANRKALAGRRIQRPSRLGIRWIPPSAGEEGLRVNQVTVGSPAHIAGIRPSDRIIAFDDRRVRTTEEMIWAVASAEKNVTIRITRPSVEEPLDLSTQLNGTPMRLGITWRRDEAEPDTILLTNVVPGSPSAQAGLKSGDRIYRIGQRDFGSDAEFTTLATAPPGPTSFLVERNGRLRTVEVAFQEDLSETPEESLVSPREAI